MAAFKDELPAVDGLEPAQTPATHHPEVAPQTSQGLEALKDIAFGSSAGILGKFVEYGQGFLASFGWLINWSLMALTWWCAHQLTWDSTVLDDGETGNSQGLLETAGIALYRSDRLA